jgi:hypothetical protein
MFYPLPKMQMIALVGLILWKLPWYSRFMSLIMCNAIRNTFMRRMPQRSACGRRYKLRREVAMV